MSDEIATWIKENRRETMDENSSMSELAGWIPVNCRCRLIPIEKPKRKSWIEKIRDYDYQKAMKDYLKESRDMWQETAIAKSGQAEWYKELVMEEIYNPTLGRRLKFSVGHNHIEIIVGNPVTRCAIWNSTEEIEYWETSVCNPKDQYNWKTGVIKSLENTFREENYPKELQREIKKALAKKYPEVFEVKK